MFDPNAAAPVAVVAAGVTPAILFAVLPLPIVIIDVEAQFRLVLRPALHSPAVAFFVAHDGSRRGHRTDDDGRSETPARF